MFFFSCKKLFSKFTKYLPISILMAAASKFFSGTVRYTQKTFCENLKVIGTSQDEWLSCDKNHPQRCVLRKNYVFVKKMCF